MEVVDTLSRIPNKTSNTGFEGPDQKDPYFPYISENVGNILTPDGTPFSNLLKSSSSENDNIEVNNVHVLPGKFTEFEPYSKHIDSPYDGDTEDTREIQTRKIHKRFKRKVPNKLNDSIVKTDIERTSTDANKITNNYISAGENSLFNSESVSKNYSEHSDLSASASEHIVQQPQDELSTVLSDSNLISDDPSLQEQIESIEIFKNFDFSQVSLKNLQIKDPYFGHITRYLVNGELPKSQKLARKVLLEAPDYSLFDNLLFHTRTAKSNRTKKFSQYQLALPEVAVKTVISLYHDTPMGGHGGIQHTMDLIREQYFFPQLSQKVAEYIKSCHACQSRKITKRKTKAGIVAFKTPSRPFQVWEIDLFGPVPVSRSGNTYILTGVDMFSKFIFVEPIPNSDSVTVSHVLYKLITQFGVFETIISDQGSEFIGRCTQEICRILDIKQQFTPSFTHHCLGTCERSHRTLAERLTPYMQQNKNWEDFIPSIIFAMNNSVNEGTGYSPFEIVYGQRPNFPLSSHVRQSDLCEIPKDYHSYVKQFIDKLSAIRNQVHENAIESQVKMITRVNSNVHNLTLTEGDYVYLAKDPTGPGQKFKFKHSGPYVIEKVNSPHLYTLTDPVTHKTISRPVHINRLKPAYVREPNPCEYFLDHVVTKQENNPSSSETDVFNLSTEIQQSTVEQTEPEPDSVQPLRRSVRRKQKPERYRDDNFVTNDDVSSPGSDESLLKVKRFLAKRQLNGKTSYLAHLTGEPAQNAIWVDETKLGPKARALLNSRPPPFVG